MPVNVGEGGEGLVYQAACIIAGAERVVALKMHTNLAFDDFERFQNRATALSKIDHPYVMRLVDVFVGTALINDDDPPDEAFAVMYTVAEWIHGLTLPTAIEATNKRRGLGWVAQVARAAEYLHDIRSADAPSGIVHRDIKPSNVRVTPEEDAVLIDFGIARPHQPGDYTEGAGTYLWQAPEVVGGPGEPGPASDAWGIGALAYWVLMEETPRLQGAAAARELLIPAARAEGLADAKGIARSISRLLDIQPARRPRDLSRWADDIDRRVARKRPPYLARVAAAVFALLVLAGGLTAIELSRGSVAPSPAQSRELANEALRVLPHNVQLGSLLSLASFVRSPTSQARSAIVAALEQPLDTILRGTGTLTAVSYNHDGTRVVTGDDQGNVALWSTPTRTLISTLHTDSPVTSVAFDPIGTSVAIGGANGDVLVFNSTDNRIVARFHVPSKVTSLAYNGSLIAIADLSSGRNLQGAAIVWDPTTGQNIKKLVPNPSAPYDNYATSIAFDPGNQNLVAFGATNGWIDLWQPTIGKIASLVISKNSDAVTGISFSSGGSRLVASYATGEVGMWNIASQSPNELPVILGVGGSVTAVTASPDADFIAASYTDGNIKVWNTEESPHAAEVIGAGGAISSMAISPEGGTIVAAESSGNVLLLSSTQRADGALQTGPNATADSVAFSQSGRLLAIGDVQGNVQLWDTTNDEKLGTLVGNGAQVSSVALDASGLRLAAGQMDDEVTVWDTLTKRKVWTKSDGTPNYSVAFSPNDNLVAGGDAGGWTMLFNSQSGMLQSVGLHDPEHASIRSIAFGDDGHILVTGDDNGYVTLWSVDNGRRVGDPILSTSGRIVRSVAVSPNGQLVAAGDGSGTVTVWDVRTHSQVWRTRVGHAVLSVTFSPDGATLVSGDDAGNIRGWYVATGTPLAPSYHIGGDIFGLAFTSDGSTLAAANEPSATLISSFIVEDASQELARRLCREVNGNLTESQWSTYLGRIPFQDLCPSS